jgi:hypothetical protein
MPCLVIVAFQSLDTSGGDVWHYRAYSSNDPGRSNAKVFRDVNYFLGYQPSNPQDCITDFGHYRFSYFGNNNMTPGQRSQGVLCVRLDNHDIDDDYTPVNRDDRYVLLEAGADEENIVECEHFIIPETNFPQDDEADSENSSTDSDTDED